ncbi:hypothetical protein LZ639_19235, partial [Pseudomonas stutzeri]|uniref:hypothetical protein n=1 Tax=Stutzerimonas stutzeri TaxID=316 RepID=UPI001F3C8E5A
AGCWLRPAPRGCEWSRSLLFSVKAFRDDRNGRSQQGVERMIGSAEIFLKILFKNIYRFLWNKKAARYQSAYRLKKYK